MKKHIIIWAISIVSLSLQAKAQDLNWIGGDNAWDAAAPNWLAPITGPQPWVDDRRAILVGPPSQLSIQGFFVQTPEIVSLNDGFEIDGPGQLFLFDNFGGPSAISLNPTGFTRTDLTVNASIVAADFHLNAGDPNSVLSLTQDNDFIGDAHVDSGTIQVHTNAGLGFAGDRTIFSESGRLILQGDLAVGRDLHFVNTGVIATIPPSISFNGNSELSGDLTFDNQTDLVIPAGQVATSTGSVTGAAGFTVAGGGHLVLSTNQPGSIRNWAGQAQVTGNSTLTLGNAIPTPSGDRQFEGDIENLSTAPVGVSFTNPGTYGNSLSGPGNVTISLEGATVLRTLSMDAPQPYTGATTLIDSRLRLQGTGTISTPSIQMQTVHQVESEIELAIDAGHVLSLAAEISGDGRVTKTGPGQAVIIGDASYTGHTEVTAGTLTFGNGGTTGMLPTGGTFSIAAGATLEIDRSDEVVFDHDFPALSNTSTFEKSGTGTLILTGDRSQIGEFSTPTFRVSGGTLQLGDGTGDSPTLDHFQTIFDLATPDSTLAYRTGGNQHALNTRGPGNFIKYGANMTTITNGPALHTGSTTVYNGILKISGFHLMGAMGSHTIVRNGAQLRFGAFEPPYVGTAGAIIGPVVGTQHSNFQKLTLDGHGPESSSGAVRLRANKIYGEIELAGDATIQNAAGAPAEVFGAVTGPGGLTKIGNGGLYLHRDNTYAGPTIVKRGTLRITSVGGFGNSPSLYIDAGAAVEVDSAAMTPVPNGAVTDLHFSNLPLQITGSGSLALTNIPAVDGGGTPIGGAFFDLQPGSTIAPGNSPGTLAFMNDVNWAGNYIWELEDAAGIAGTDWDLVTAFGHDIDLAAGGTLSILDFNNPIPTLNLAPSAVTDFEIFIADNILNFNAGTFTINPGHFLEAHGTTDLLVNGFGDALLLRFTADGAAVPEPGTVVLLGMLFIGVVAYSRNKRHERGDQA